MTGPFSLPELSRSHPPAFTTSLGCREWLSHLALANPTQAQGELLTQLNLLNRFELPMLERLRILDGLRESLQFVQEECAKRFAGRPLPLAPAEHAAFESNRLMLESFATGYLHCLQALLGGEQPDASGHASLIAERAMVALMGCQLDHYRAGLAIPAGFWRDLHRTYAAAERLGVAPEPVPDPQFDRQPVSPQAVFACSMLLHNSSPYELSARQLAIALRWLRHWSPISRVLNSPPTPMRLPAIGTDIAGAEPARHNVPDSPTTRWVEVEPLAGKLKRRISGLQQGVAPESLNLGDDCKQPACEQLLRHVYEHCCKGGVGRSQPRRGGQGDCRIAVGADAVYYYVAGEPFRQPLTSTSASKQQIDEIATFGRVSTRHEDKFSEQQGFTRETWQVIDESAGGLQLARAQSTPGSRIARGGLLAVAVPGTQGFMLAMVRWAMLAADGAVRAGVRVIPGAPVCITVRPAGLPFVKDKWRPAFLLPAIPSLQVNRTAIVQASWFRPERIIDLHAGPIRAMRLTHLVERGADFERVEFEPA